jgi:isoquinoline 1-oxidoreductase beta subunit
VRYEKAGHKDFILMLGADAKGYDVPHQLVEQVYEDTGIRTAPLRGIGFTANKFATETFMDEIAYKRGVDTMRYRLDLLAKTPRAHTVLERVAHMADWGRSRNGHGLGTAYIDYSDTQVAAVVEISIDRSTGKIKLHNVWCAIDCGVAVQPDNVVAQTESSIVYGIGLALTERISLKDGAVEQANFYDYIVSRNRDVPPMYVEVIQTDNKPTGVGQMATPLITPAVSNAVMALTGVRLRHAPFIEERVKKALA